MLETIVRLTTTGTQNGVGVYLFQFGTVPAPPESYELLTSTVEVGTEGEEIFRLYPDIEVPAGQAVRFNIRFELDIHNSANLQLRVRSGAELEWRWSAPIGYVGKWSAVEETAPWSDDDMDYSITIRPGRPDVIDVAVSEHAG